MNCTPILPTKQTTNGPVLALRLREAAKAIGVSERTLWGLRDVPRVRLGSAVLYPIKELTEWLTKHVESATDAPESAPSGEGNRTNTGDSEGCSGRMETRGGVR
jgi:hypothetical protein